MPRQNSMPKRERSTQALSCSPSHGHSLLADTSIAPITIARAAWATALALAIMSTYTWSAGRKIKQIKNYRELGLGDTGSNAHSAASFVCSDC